jgi:serine protease Do
MRRFGIVGVAFVFVVAGLILGLALSSNFNIQTKGYTKNRGEISSGSVDILSRVSNAMVDVVSAVRPSVVNISTKKVLLRRDGGMGGGMFDDPFFRRFFGDDFFRNFQQPKEEKSSSLGSGVIVMEEGYILTNNHVIKDADEIKVILSDKSEYMGEVVGTDPKTDLAVVKIDANGLKAIEWGDSDRLRVGETVIAVGSPYGLNQTVTSGIVSAKGRANVKIADYEDFIQTDAAINPGNSGGPLVNIRGELVGINTAIFSTSGGYQGIGFSIPSNMARVVLDSLVSDGKVIRGWLGVTIQGITKELAGQFNLKSEKGALVSDVISDSPAEKAGLKRGDIIVEFDGKEVENQLGLRNMVASTRPGSKVALKIMRDGKEKTLTVEIGELPEDKMGVTGAYDNVLRDVHVQELTPELRRSLGISKRVKGVVVADAPMDTALRRGDVVLEVNRNQVENVADYDKVVSRIGSGMDVLLLLFRDGSVFYLTLSEQ